MMAMFMAKSILDGFVSYKKVFDFELYKRYQDDVDLILIAEGREELIDRSE